MRVDLFVTDRPIIPLERDVAVASTQWVRSSDRRGAVANEQTRDQNSGPSPVLPK